MAKISIVGSGYVGFSLAIVLSQRNEVSLLDIDEKKIKTINKKKSPLSDSYADKFLSDENSLIEDSIYSYPNKSSSVLILQYLVLIKFEAKYSLLIKKLLSIRWFISKLFFFNSNIIFLFSSNSFSSVEPSATIIGQVTLEKLIYFSNIFKNLLLLKVGITIEHSFILN